MNAAMAVRSGRDGGTTDRLISSGIGVATCSTDTVALPVSGRLSLKKLTVSSANALAVAAA